MLQLLMLRLLRPWAFTGRGVAVRLVVAVVAAVVTVAVIASQS